MGETIWAINKGFIRFKTEMNQNWPKTSKKISIIIVLYFTLISQSFADSMTIELHGDGGNVWGSEWFQATGEIVPETPDSLEKIFRTYSGTPYILFNSTGGNLFAGLEIGRLLRKYDATVAIGTTEKDPDYPPWSRFGSEPAICSSACAYAFLGGLGRTAEPGELGLHQFHSNKALLNIDIPAFSARDLLIKQAISGALLQYIVEIGADTEIYTLAANTPPNQLLFLDSNQLDKLGINTKRSTASHWSLQPFKNGLIAEISQIDYSQNTRRARLYCTSDAFYFTVFVKNDDWSNDVIEVLNKTNNLRFDLSENNGYVKTIKKFVIDKDETLVLAFEIDEITARELATTQTISFDYFHNAARVEFSYYQALQFDEIKGNLGLPNFAFEHCI